MGPAEGRRDRTAQPLAPTHDRPPTEANPPVIFALGTREPRTTTKMAPDYTGGKGLEWEVLLGLEESRSSHSLSGHLGFGWAVWLAAGRAGSALGLELGRVASHPHDFRSYDAGPKIESSLLHMSHSRSSPRPLSGQRRILVQTSMSKPVAVFLLPLPPKEPEARCPCSRKSAMPGRVYLLGCFCSWLCAPTFL